MSFLLEVVAWFLAPQHWAGSDGIPNRIQEHVVLSAAITAAAVLIALSWKLGFGFWPTFMALVPLGISPILTNSYVAVREVDRDIVEAARGMGLREHQVLRSVELPIA